MISKRSLKNQEIMVQYNYNYFISTGIVHIIGLTPEEIEELDRIEEEKRVTNF